MKTSDKESESKHDHHINKTDENGNDDSLIEQSSDVIIKYGTESNDNKNLLIGKYQSPIGISKNLLRITSNEKKICYGLSPISEIVLNLSDTNIDGTTPIKSCSYNREQSINNAKSSSSNKENVALESSDLCANFILYYFTILTVTHSIEQSRHQRLQFDESYPSTRSIEHPRHQKLQFDETYPSTRSNSGDCHISNDKYSPEFNVTTPALPNTIYYTYIPIPSNEQTCLSIKIRAKNNAYLALTEYPENGHKSFHIIFGLITDSKMVSSIIDKNDVSLTELPTPDVINDKEYREFVIKWQDGQIMVIGGIELIPFLYYKVQNMYPVNYIGIATHGTPGTWIIGKDCNQIQKSTVDSVTDCLPQQQSKTIISEKPTSQFNNLISLQQYFLNQMTNDYKHLNNSVQQQNDKEFLVIYKYELKDNYKIAKEIHNEIILKQIKYGDNNNNIEQFNVAENMFANIRELFFQYYGNLQILLNNLNRNNMIENIDSKKQSYKSENMESIDEYYQITKNGCIKFKVHRSAGFIRITLTNGYTKTLKLKILINENSEMEAWEDSQYIGKLKVSTPIFMERAEYESYLLSWNDRNILVYQSDKNYEFINRKNTIDFADLKYFNIMTENVGDIPLEIEESECSRELSKKINQIFTIQ